MDYAFQDMPPADPEAVEEAADYFAEMGFQVI